MERSLPNTLDEAPSATIAHADLANWFLGRHTAITRPSHQPTESPGAWCNVNVAAVGDHSSAHAYTVTAGSTTIYINLVTFEQGHLRRVARTD